MNAKSLFLTLITGCALSLGAQNIESRQLDIDTKRAPYVLTEEEKKEPVVVLYEKRSHEMIYEGPSGDAVRYITAHKIVRVNDEAQVNSLNKIYIPVSNRDDLVTLRARVTRKDGKVFDLYKGDMKQITEEGQDYLILALDGLEKDAEFEYFFIVRGAVTAFFTEYISNRSYTRDYTFELISPDNMVYESKSYNGMPTATDTVMKSKQFIRFHLTNLPPMEEEKYTTDRAYMKRAEIKLSYNKNIGTSRIYTFTSAAKRYYSRLHDIDKKDQTAVSKLAKELKLKKMSTIDEKVRAIENDVKMNYGYLPGKSPTLADAIKNKALDDFYFNQLCVLLLEEAEVDYEVVMTSDRMDNPFDPEFETWNYLDNILIYIPETKKYLVPEAIIYRYGLVPSQYVNQKGLFLRTIAIGETKSALNSVKFIEPMPKENSIDNMEAVLVSDLSKDNVTLHIERSQNGYPAVFTRPFYFYEHQEEKRAEVTDQLLKLGLEDAKVKNLVVKNFDINTDEVYKPFTCTADVETQSLLEKAGEDYMLKIGLCIGPQVEMYQEKPRKYPIYTGYAHSYKRVLKVQIPEGYSVKGLDPIKMNIVLNDNGVNTAGFISDYQLSDKELVIEVSEFYDKDEYPVDQFNQYRDVINASADFNKLTILFTKKK